MNDNGNVNYAAMEAFRNVFDSKGNLPKNWIYYCIKQMKFYLGDKREFYQKPDDIVDQVIFLTINGTRKWDPEKVPLEAHVKMCIKSLLSHMAESRDMDRAEGVTVNKKTGEKINALENAHVLSRDELEKLYSNKDLIERCREELDDDTEMGLVFELMLEQRTPKEMAEYGVTPRQVDALKKRIYRFLKKIFDEDDYLDM